MAWSPKKSHPPQRISMKVPIPSALIPHHQGLHGLDLTAGHPARKARPLLLLLALLPLALGMLQRSPGGGLVRWAYCWDIMAKWVYADIWSQIVPYINICNMYIYIYIVYDCIYHICNYLPFSEKGKWTKIVVSHFSSPLGVR